MPGCLDGRSVLPAIPVPIPVAPAATASASATVLPSAAAPSTTLFGSIAALAVNRTVPTWFKRHRRGLSATGADHGCSRAHPSARTAAVTALVLGVGRGVAASAGALLCLAAWLAATGRGVAAFLEELLFASSEGKFLTAVATGENQVAAAHGYAPFSVCTANAPRAMEWYTQKSLPHTCLWIRQTGCTNWGQGNDLN